MKIRKEKSRVTIEIYDADGEMRESIGGQYTFREIRDMMRDIIQNDGIPVIRQMGKHEATEKTVTLNDMAKEAMKGFSPVELMRPLALEYKFDGIEFRAAGNPLDVHAANEALLKRVFEEE